MRSNALLNILSAVILLVLPGRIALGVSFNYQLQYDSAGRVTAVAVDQDNSITYTYFPHGQLSQIISVGTDLCPDDPEKNDPGTCGCGIAETDHDTDGTPDCTDPDDDNDGLTDIVENQGCTDALDADTDDDGIADGMEAVYGTDPCDIDSDNDGIQDGTELGYTDADRTADTDTNVFQPDLDPSATTDPLSSDSDNDGLQDGAEDSNHNGRVDAGETDPASGRLSVPLPGILLLLLK